MITHEYLSHKIEQNASLTLENLEDYGGFKRLKIGCGGQ
jgi:hypothetical protein